MRGLVRLIAVVAGLVLAAFGALLAVQVLAGWLSPTSQLLVPWTKTHSALRGVSWGELPVRAASVLAVILGLLLVAVTVLARRHEIRLHDPSPEVTVTIDPRSMARLVGHQVRKDEAVSTASVTATRKRVRVKALSKYSSLGDLRSRLTESAEHTVRELPLRTGPRVSVSVSAPQEKT